MSVQLTSTNFSSYSSNVTLYHPTGSTIPYFSATTTNVGTQTIPFVYTASTDVLEYGTFEFEITSFTPSKICTSSKLAGPDGDGNYYRTIKIGNQIWMSENLKTTKFLDGTPLDNPGGTSVDDATWTGATGSSTKYWAYVNNNSANTEIYGLLYNQYAVTGSTTGATPSTNLCPSGWHVPTSAETVTLQTAMGGASAGGGNGKIPGTVYWVSPNTGANNSLGFNAVGAGYRSTDGSFFSFRFNSYWWSSTPTSYWYFNYNVANFILNTFGSRYGFSVRCLKD